MKHQSFTILIAFLLAVAGCKTYEIPRQSFAEQFAGIDSTALRVGQVRGPAGDSHPFLANPIEVIKCRDKSGQEVTLANSPSIEVRITDQNNKKTTFYFDTLYFADSLLIGCRSRFIPSFTRTIPFQSIKKIEIQDGKKAFRYVKGR